ncbi:MAG: DcrB-related protein [Pseudomonadota bacterium]
MILRALLFLPLLLSLGCDNPSIPWLWKTYEHPTYRFRLRMPRSWSFQQDSVMGSAVMLLAPEDDPVFRTNINIVVQLRREKLTLEQMAAQSSKQLELIFNQYRLLGEAKTTLGDISALELRGRYLAREGPRIVRTVIALTLDTIYVFTFTCREEREGEFQKTFDGVRESFRAPQT